MTPEVRRKSWVRPAAAAGAVVAWGVLFACLPILAEFRDADIIVNPPVTFTTSYSYGWPAIYRYSPLYESPDPPGEFSFWALILDLSCLAGIGCTAWILAAVPASGFAPGRVVTLCLANTTAVACVFASSRFSVGPDLEELQLWFFQLPISALIVSTTSIVAVVAGGLAERRFGVASLIVVMLAAGILLAVFLPALRGIFVGTP